MKTTKAIHIGLGLLFLLACYFPFFLHLDSLPLSIYDEAKRAVSSLEMLERQDFLVTYYDGAPDLVGTKPPLLNWLQASFMQFLGYHELSIRLPSALAGLATILLLVFFGRKALNHLLLGLFAGLFLLTFNGYIEHHVCRTGDFDALLTFFTTAYILTFFRFAEKPSSPLLYWTSGWIMLAALTKGIAGLFFLPVLLLWAIHKKVLTQIFRPTRFLIALSVVFLPLAAYYGLRELYNPGFLQAVWQNELGGRFLNTIDTHQHPLWFYLHNLWSFQLGWWKYWLWLGAFAFLHESALLKRLSVYLLLAIAFHLTLISLAQTKLIWYNAPVFPLLCLWLGIGLSALFQRLLGAFRQISKQSLSFLFVLLFFSWPYGQILKKVYQPQPQPWEDSSYARYMRSHSTPKQYLVSTIGFNPSLLFYRKALNAQGYQIGTFYPKQRREEGPLYLLCGERPKRLFRVKHQLSVQEYWEDCELVQVTGYQPKPYQWPEGEAPKE